MSVKDLIGAIASKDAVETEKMFNAVMSTKVSAALDDMRIEVAKSMFASQEEQPEAAAEQPTEEPTE